MQADFEMWFLLECFGLAAIMLVWARHSRPGA